MIIGGGRDEVQGTGYRVQRVGAQKKRGTGVQRDGIQRKRQK